MLKPRLSEIAYHMIAYSQITERQVNLWTSDIDIFVTDEYDSNDGHRIAAAELLDVSFFELFYLFSFYANNHLMVYKAVSPQSCLD